MLLEHVDVGEAAVDAVFDSAFHPVAGVEQRLLAQVGAEHREHRVPHLVEHPVLVLATACGHCADHLLKHQYVLDLGHVGHHDLAPPQIVHLLVVAPVAVDYAVGIHVVECRQVVERAGGLDHLVAAAERLDCVGFEYQRIEFGVDGVHAVAFDEEHRFARSDDGHVDLVGDALARCQQVVVPGGADWVVVAHPHYRGVGARRGELQIVSGVDKHAVGAHGLHDVPQRLHDRRMEEHFGRVDKHRRSLRGVEHCSEIVYCSFLAVAEFQSRVAVGVFRIGPAEEEASRLDEYVVVGKYFRPGFYQAVDACGGE